MTPREASQQAAEICRLAPVVPVITVEELSRAAPLAEALVAGGLPALEVTLRTPDALEAISIMAEVEGGVVGAGTLLTPRDVEAAKAAGALLGVSPGATDAILDAAEAGHRRCGAWRWARCSPRSNSQTGWQNCSELLS